MSRKEPTFSQLAAYMSSEKSDARYDIHHGCIAGSDEDIAKEFYANSEHLTKRQNANYLYHEIVSITTEEGYNRQMTKEALREIAERYIQQRCSNNMVYGCLHEDHKSHLHYHLMVSANEKGESKRLRLTKKQFDQVKRELEAHVLKHYPQLKQKEVITAVSQNEKMSVKGDAMKRRTGSLPQREEVCQTVREAMSQTSSMDNFCFFLNERGYDFYVRGKNFGVRLTHENGKTKSYRFSTLGLHEDFQAFQDGEYVKQGEEKFARSSEKIPSEAPREPEAESIINDTASVENTVENESMKVDVAEKAKFEAEKPVEDKSQPAVEKEKEEMRSQLKRQREADDRNEDESGSSI